MNKPKVVVTRSAGELARALGLTRADGAEIELRSDLNSKIVAVVQRKGLTHAQVARLAGTSRTRVTAIMNRNTRDICFSFAPASNASDLSSASTRALSS